MLVVRDGHHGDSTRAAVAPELAANFQFGGDPS
jgi:hypothetical protein